MRRQWQSIDGVLLVDKPQGPSSNGVLQQVRRIFNAEKAGHGGTLDPMATGLLIVCFGEAAKYSSGLLQSDKKYSGTIVLGVRTATGDAEGEVIERAEVKFDGAALELARQRLLGDIEQTPPAYSAIKVDGQPSYAYARAGVEIAHNARRVHISAFEIGRVNETTLRFTVRCSSGTYVRVLAEDLGRSLGTLAHLGSLRRESSGPFEVASALSPDDLGALSCAERLARLLAVDAPLYALPRMTLDASAVTALRHGKRVLVARELYGKSRLYSPDGQFAGVVETTVDGEVIPLRMMRASDSVAER